jgi:type IV secretory pathway VirB2 component (pilin)
MNVAKVLKSKRVWDTGFNRIATAGIFGRISRPKRNQANAEWTRIAPLVLVALLVVCSPIYAQSDPWTTAINKLVAVFQGPIAKGMSIIGVVAGAFGLIFDTGHHAKTLSGIVLGVSMALGATAFLSAFFS